MFVKSRWHEEFKALGQLDHAILMELQKGARKSLSAIGRAVGLSQPAIADRVRRLEESGVISEYRTVLSSSSLGASFTAIIRLQTVHGQIEKCLRAFRAMPEILEIDRLTGTDCFLLRVIVPNPGRLEQIVDQIAGFGPVNTSIVLSSEPTKPIATARLFSDQ